ncbi:glycosyltransferase family 4 protein [Arcobacter sp. YIC-310]|uniref:glycosyltransferase family 4 protein n=1 Tax=Arcobacter sp. YIC-310 TaxID=3376632 RepID=UPI003C2529FA
MKKILYILNSNGIGGAEASIKRMNENYFKNADVLTMWGHTNVQKDFWDFKHNGKVINITEQSLSISILFKVIKELISYLKSNNYDVIQTQLKGSDIIIGFLVYTGFLKKNKLVASLRNNYEFYYESGLKNRLVGKVHQFFMKKVFDKIVVVSRQDLDKFQKVFGEKLVVIENSINYEKFHKKENYDLKKQEIQVALVGNVKHRKGYDKLNELFKFFKNENKIYVFNIAGGIEDIDLKNSVINDAENYDNIKVNFVGKISDINEFLLDNDIFLSLSRVEGLPISVLEAMAIRIPIILSNIEAHSLIVSDDIYDSVLFDNIEQCFINIENIQNTYSQIIESQYKLLEERFNFVNMCKKYEEIYISK